MHLLQILQSGRIIVLQHLGKHCWDDDNMVLSEQAHAEARWRRSQVATTHFPLKSQCICGEHVHWPLGLHALLLDLLSTCCWTFQGLAMEEMVHQPSQSSAAPLLEQPVVLPPAAPLQRLVPIRPWLLRSDA